MTAPEALFAETSAFIAISSDLRRTPEVPPAVMVEPRVMPDAVTDVLPAETKVPVPELVKAPDAVTVMFPEPVVA